MPQTIAPDDSRLSWPGAVSLENADGGVAPWRIPHEERILFADTLQERASYAAGVRVAFRTDSPFVAGCSAPCEEGALLDLCVNGEWLGSAPVDGPGEFRFDGLPSGEKAVELWFPQKCRFVLSSLELADGASLLPHEDARPRWTAYGSSISQCATAASPCFTWPAIVARTRGYNLTCLGYGGNCHLEPMVARLVRDLPADYLSLCVGINIYGSGSLGKRTFREALIGFVKILRENHEGKPCTVMSPIWSPSREKTENVVGWTLEAMRETVQAAVEALRDRGDGNLHYVDGLAIFGPELEHLLPDGLHPNAEGYKAMGKNFAEKVAARFFA